MKRCENCNEPNPEGWFYCRECGHFGPSKDEDKCIFVGEPYKLIKKYKQNTNDDG